MNENKMKFADCEFVANFLKTYAANGGSKTEQELREKNVGNNGYTLGQQFTFTGEIKVKENTINGAKQTYIVLPTEEGTELSLMAIMGVSSLKGYDLENPVTIEFKNGTKKDSRTTKTELIADFDFSQVWQPKTRNFLELAGMIAEGALPLKGVVATYLGIAVKPITAKKAGDSNGEKFDKDYKRAIETRLWSIAI